MLPLSHFRRGGRATTRLASSVLSPSSSSTSFLPHTVDRRGFRATPSLGAKMRQRPLMEGFDKRLLRAMTEPVYPKEVLYPVRVNPITPYQQYRIDWMEYMKWFVDGVLERNEVFGFFYGTKPDNLREFNRMAQTFRQAGLHLRLWEAKDVRIVVEGTKYENIRAILNDNVLFCHPYEDFQEGMPKDYVPPPKIDNVTAVKEMIRLGRVMPLVTLLGGVIEDELVTRARMVEYTELGTLDSQRAQICGLLSGAPSMTSGLLSHHQNVLGATLSAYVAERTKENERTVEGIGGEEATATS